MAQIEIVASLSIRWTTRMRILAYLWAAPNTLFGIAVGLVLLGRFRIVDGAFEVHGKAVAYALDRLPVSAMALTMGHVVFGQTSAALDITRKHERVHVAQYERWGPGFIPAYLFFSAYMWARGRDPYRDNPFEVEAFAVDTPDWGSPGRG